MKKVLFFLITLFFLLLILYVFPKSPDFPEPPVEFVQSSEPADVETSLRRGYYTNLTRDEVMNYYKKVFNDEFNFYTPRLNYPPEEAQSTIRDQTKSTFLEEIVHPLRESLYINGFEPKSEEYAQFYDGIRYNQKIIVKYIPSPVWIRLVVLVGSLIATYFLINEYENKKTK